MTVELQRSSRIQLTAAAAALISSLMTSTGLAQVPVPPAPLVSAITAATGPWTPITSIDFSPRHDQLILNFDGSKSHMDDVYFWPNQIATNTWQILADGDYFYVVEGDTETLLIDAGYGVGNPRAFAQTLTKKPIKYVANTHTHFDHVANNAYFDAAYMSQETKDRLPQPSATFAGINFPKSYPIRVVKEGDKIELGNRTIEVIMLGNHAIGSTAYLDRKGRILYSGDDIMGPQGMNVRTTVEDFAKMIEKLMANRKDIDTLAAGWEMMPAYWLDKYQALAKSILDGSNPGVPVAQAPPAPLPNNWKINANAPRDAQGKPIFFRHLPRGGGGIVPAGAVAAAGQAPRPNAPAPNPNLMRVFLNGATLTYDRTKIGS